MVVLGGGAVSYDRGNPIKVHAGQKVTHGAEHHPRKGALLLL